MLHSETQHHLMEDFTTAQSDKPIRLAITPIPA